MNLKSNDIDALPRTYTMAEIGEIYCVSERSLRKYIKSGKLKAVRFGKYLRITQQSLLDLLEGSR